MPLRRAAASVIEASEGFLLKACKLLPVLRTGSSLTPPSTSSHLVANEVEANAHAA
jgi:hypothetical protein